MKTYIVYTVEQARELLKGLSSPSNSILFTKRNGLPIAAWAPDGRSSGILYTRFNVLNQGSPYHQHAGSADAYYLLKQSIKK